MNNILTELLRKKEEVERLTTNLREKIENLYEEIEGCDYTIQELNDGYDYLNDAIYSLDVVDFNTWELEDIKDSVYREIEEKEDFRDTLEDELKDVKEELSELDKRLKDITNHIINITNLLEYCINNDIVHSVEDYLLIELGLITSDYDASVSLED